MAGMQSLQKGYILAARGLSRLSEEAGIARWLEGRQDRSRMAHWLRSLGAIHDLEKLAVLDVPWWTYEAIERVDQFLQVRPQARVFEWGAGASTIWLARRAASVTSIEHAAEWHERVALALERSRGLCPVDLRLIAPDPGAGADPMYLSAKAGSEGRSFSRYARSIELGPPGGYDLVVIDGRARGACLVHAVRQLAPEGMIVFDNTKRARYREAISQSGLAAMRLRGLTPALPYLEETTLLSRPCSGS